MNLFKNIIFLLFFLVTLIGYGQKGECDPYFSVHEIQIISGPYSYGSKSITLDYFGLTLRRIDFDNSNRTELKAIDFQYLLDQGSEDFKRNYQKLLSFLCQFDYETKTHEPIENKNEIVIQNGDTLINYSSIPSHDLGTRILIIDENFQSHYFKYYYCEKELDKLVGLINNLVPINDRNQYSIELRCNK